MCPWLWLAYDLKHCSFDLNNDNHAKILMDTGYKFISDFLSILNLPKFFQNVLTGANLSRPA